MHDLVARTQYSQYHGRRSPQEFSEFPSMLAENWCWMEEVLQEISCHYSALCQDFEAEWRKNNPDSQLPPTQLPHKQAAMLADSRRHNMALQHLRQLYVLDLSSDPVPTKIVLIVVKGDCTVRHGCAQPSTRERGVRHNFDV